MKLRNINTEDITFYKTTLKQCIFFSITQKELNIVQDQFFIFVSSHAFAFPFSLFAKYLVSEDKPSTKLSV